MRMSSRLKYFCGVTQRQCTAGTVVEFARYVRFLMNKDRAYRGRKRVAMATQEVL